MLYFALSPRGSHRRHKDDDYIYEDYYEGIHVEQRKVQKERELSGRRIVKEKIRVRRAPRG